MAASSTPKTPDKSFTIVYEEAPGLVAIPVTGAHGGPSPDGAAVVANLYIEGGTVPAIEEHAVGADGKVDTSKGNEVKRGDITRRIVATLVLPPEAAIRVGNWLAGKGRLAMANRGKNPPE